MLEHSPRELRPYPLPVTQGSLNASKYRPFDAGSESGGRSEPLLHRWLRKLKTNDRFFSAMVFAFQKLQSLGISLGPNHFYWPVPDVASIRQHCSAARVLDAPLDLRFPAQLELLEQVASEYATEWNFSEDSRADSVYHYNNGFFESVDAEIAYSFVRRFKPARIIEVGGGFSTRLLTQALQANFEQHGIHAELTTIDPGFPAPRDCDQIVRTQVIRQPVQQIGLERFLALDEGDILFLDSSHVVSLGSDVVYEYLEIIPRLRKGVLIHAHDIFFPCDYPVDWVMANLSFWTEQYLLLAFLSFNTSFEVLWSSSGMQLFHPHQLERMVPHWKQSYRKLPKQFRRSVPSRDGQRIWPSSFWMRRAV